MTMLGVLATSLALATVDPASACSLVRFSDPFVPRPEHWVLAEATPDSAIDGKYYWVRGTEFLRERSNPFDREITVYGQVMRVVDSADPRATPRGSRILVVWWQLGLACQAWPPGKAVVLDSGAALFVHRIRDSVPSPSGLPVLDIIQGRSIYHDPLRSHNVYYSGGAPDTARAMSIRDLMQLMRALPDSLALATDRDRALEPLRRWHRRNPRLARQSPARSILETTGLVPIRVEFTIPR